MSGPHSAIAQNLRCEFQNEFDRIAGEYVHTLFMLIIFGGVILGAIFSR